MDVTPLIPAGRKIITGYGNGGFKINNEFVPGSLLIAADKAHGWAVTNAASITMEDLQPLLAGEPVDLLLIGTGEHMAMVSPTLRLELKARGVGADVMDTGAACRTYNILISEERRVAAALIAI